MTSRFSGAPPAEVEACRGYLLRYAMLQLRDRSAAEDAVQETLLAALQAGESFGGRSSLKTWLTGILKHKIIDHLRRQSRERPLPEGAGDTGAAEDALVETLFAADGHWSPPPQRWASPDASLEDAQFWAVFETCVATMPARTARVFLMRELMELSTDEICKEMAITPTNCWVLLHRARLALRECLATRWFRP